MTWFEESVLKIVCTIPKGKVMSYGQIAKLLNLPKAAREVGHAMHTLGGTPDFPWWRVLNNKGQISIPEKWKANPRQQQRLLEAEGIEFISDLQLDIEHYRFQTDDSPQQTSLFDQNAK